MVLGVGTLAQISYYGDRDEATKSLTLGMSDLIILLFANIEKLLRTNYLNANDSN